MPTPAEPGDVRAAGGVVCRVRDRRVEVALVHRPRYDDWSLPKGKLRTGESELAAAVREVGEEIGARVAVSRRIGTVGYLVEGARKQVTFWAMRHRDGEFEPGAEVDDIAWLQPSLAVARLTYPVERRVLADFAAVPLPDAVVVLVRHAKAGKRSQWSGPDDERPLEATGRAQAERLAAFLSAFTPQRVVSARPARCVQTVRPLADRLGLPVEIDRTFDDESWTLAPERTETALLALSRPGSTTVVCSQGATIPGLVDRLGRGVQPSDTRKGAAWVLSVVDGSVVGADYYEDAAR